MALKDTVKEMNDLLNGLVADLEKAERGNKAASQRVRTGTVRLEKVAKRYRKESIAIEKRGGIKKKPATKTKTTKTTRAKTAKPAPKARTTTKAKKPTQKKSAKPGIRARAATGRRSTAKLPRRRAV